jgi:hypothetical protein
VLQQAAPRAVSRIPVSLWWLLCSRLAQLDAIKRIRHSIDQLTRDIRDVASVDLILEVLQRDTQRR